jgi:Cephalosporin hydroxylase
MLMLQTELLCLIGRECYLMSLLASVLGEYKSRSSVEARERLKARIQAVQTGRFGWLADIPCALLFGRDLRMLAGAYFTDKWSSHWYAQHYEDRFRQVRRRKLSILEIGIGGYDDPRMGGGSLRMWRTYFPNGRVYGIDIYEKSAHNRRRIKTFRGSQTDPLFLDSVVREIGKIDIIIDDGSHRNEDVLLTFQHLFPHLADGGFYVVEDTQTSYWPNHGGDSSGGNNPHTTMGYFKSLTDGLNWEEFRGDRSPSYLDLNIKSIAFYHNLIFITKGTNREGSTREELQGGDPCVKSRKRLQIEFEPSKPRDRDSQDPAKDLYSPQDPARLDKVH